MQFFASINIKSLKPSITYKDNILLVGSCFTEHIGDYLMDIKFSVLQNPNGILFNPISICESLVSYIHNKQYNENELFFLNEAWHSWQHHSRFSNEDLHEGLRIINESQNIAHEFLQKAGWIIITLGSSFVYKLSPEASSTFQRGVISEVVANCHKAPAQAFIRHLCSIEETVSALDKTIHQLFHFNPQLKIIFTISPVRHLRDGVVENNQSKARLIEVVHHLVNKFDKLYYFPAYELVIDILRDYRFYDIDLAHPNYAATQFVLEKFTENCFDTSTQELMKEIRKIIIAKNHSPFNSHSQQHKKFLQMHWEKTKVLQQQYPWIDFKKEMEYFSGA